MSFRSALKDWAPPVVVRTWRALWQRGKAEEPPNGASGPPSAAEAPPDGAAGPPSAAEAPPEGAADQGLPDLSFFINFPPPPPPEHDCLPRLRADAERTPRRQAGVYQLGSLLVHYTDIMSLCGEYRDIFIRKIYHFTTAAPRPRILDGGACVGMATLYWRQVYPEARITCFEPDPGLARVLRTNLEANGAGDVEVVVAGLAGSKGSLPFVPDGMDGGRFLPDRDVTRTMRTVPLSDYLDEPVDLLKLNIEGHELPVLQEAEASGRLHNVREIVLEYHGWPKERQALGAILELLDRQGYRYLVHDFDEETGFASKPPFQVRPDQTWFALVYGKRLEGPQVPASEGTGGGPPPAGHAP
jgi:FkbM family methyltransferase